MAYPVHYIRPLKLADGTLVQLRPIHPSDGQWARYFRSVVSERTVKARFLGYEPAISRRLVDRLTKIDYRKEMAIVAEQVLPSEKLPIAVARVVGEVDEPQRAEFALIVADQWQGKGLGTALTDFMIDIARRMDFDQLTASLLATNQPMRTILRKKGFQIQTAELGTIEAVLELGQT